MGTPMRSKSFHAAYYGDMGDNGLPDQVAGMKQLAEKYPWIDVDRAGIYGHSGGGYATADAMFRYPDFFKVGDLGGRATTTTATTRTTGARSGRGCSRPRPDGTTNYDNQANQLVAKNLKGKLLLAHGTIDNNVPPYNTLLVVNALIAANKDFDLIMLPNRHARLRQRAVHGAAAVGLLREEPARRRAAARVQAAHAAAAPAMTAKSGPDPMRQTPISGLSAPAMGGARMRTPGRACRATAGGSPLLFARPWRSGPAHGLLRFEAS